MRRLGTSLFPIPENIPPGTVGAGIALDGEELVVLVLDV